ncbi:SGNH/GDSL hydrolase family protein [Runella sp.]|uniref:SGNH/GDSL hydrolase family protein n=1 Tax=Runella sp. TaxID=1960881 RepID=UPI0026166DB9|nr:SGNH/GDSL hydrolase family protein [Runella sp.]
MKLIYSLILLATFISFNSPDKNNSDYLNDVKTELQKTWPKNRTINLVFHGHSVPAGFFKTPVVNTLQAYPFLVLKELKTLYPYAVINVINTSIGGENSVGGEKRFESEVLIHRADVLFIDYALNDRSVGPAKASEAWSKMIEKALEKKIKVILLTPSPDQNVKLSDDKSDLEKHRLQIIALSQKYGVGLVDSYEKFKQKFNAGEPVSEYMSQVNHPNEKGHALIANQIMEYFK